MKTNAYLNILAKLRSWTTSHTLIPKVASGIDDSSKTSESWKLVRSAEKEMHEKMNTYSKKDRSVLDKSRIVLNGKNKANVQEKISKWPTIVPKDDSFTPPTYTKQSR